MDEKEKLVMKIVLKGKHVESEVHAEGPEEICAAVDGCVHLMALVIRNGQFTEEQLQSFLRHEVERMNKAEPLQ